MARLRDRHPDAFGSIKEGTAIIGFRNRLIHGYDAVDADIAWDVIVNKLLVWKQPRKRCSPPHD